VPKEPLKIPNKKVLRRDVTVTQSAVMPQYVVCPFVTFRYDFHSGWNISKIISRAQLPETLVWRLDWVGYR